eukprot:2235713-Prymnesium_polylepis.1
MAPMARVCVCFAWSICPLPCGTASLAGPFVSFRWRRQALHEDDGCRTVLEAPRGQYRWAGGLLSPPYATLASVWHT